MKNPVENLVKSYAKAADILFHHPNNITFYQQSYFSGFLNQLANVIEGMDTQRRLSVEVTFSPWPTCKNMILGLSVTEKEYGERVLELIAVRNHNIKICSVPYANGGVSLFLCRPNGSYDGNAPFARLDPRAKRLNEFDADELTRKALRILEPHYTQRPEPHLRRKDRPLTA